MRNFFAAVICIVGVSATFADPASVQMGLGAYRLGSGGEFTYSRVSGDFLPGGQSGISFCVELDEYFSPGGTYFTNISNVADNGGVGGPDPDPLDPRTASVFKNWFSEANKTNLLAGQYQMAIWTLEEEAVYDTVDGRWEYNNGSNTPISGFESVTQAAVTALTGAVGAGDLSGVAIMQLWSSWSAGDGYGGPGQDQLILVPVPAALLLGSIGVGMVGWIKRRRIA